MMVSMLKWHLSRDNQAKLVRFCENNKQTIVWQLNTADVDGVKYHEATFHFDNGGFITAEMGEGISTGDHFQVVNYGLGV